MKRALAGRGCRFHTVGIRAKHLPMLEEVSGVSVILMCGVAGALDSSLRIGDVVFDGKDAQMPDLRYSDGPGGISLRRGTIHSANQIISNPSQKAELFTSTGALAVDMEQSIVRDFASPLQIPVIGLRAISDTADQVLDAAVLHLVDDVGKPRPLKIASLLLHRPNLIPYLNQLGTNTKIAVNNLGKAAVEIVDKLTASKGN